jgi:hypothetical protein
MTARALQAFRIASQVDRYAYWKTSSGPDAALARIEAHLPKGTKLGMYGEQIGVEDYATYTFPTIDRPYLGSRALLLLTLIRRGGGSIVLAEGQVRYIAPRPYDQRIPEQARALDITVGSNLSRPLLSRTVTNVSEVHRIAQMVDRLPFVGNESGTAFSCGVNLPTFPVDRFIFRAAPGGPVLAKVTELADTPSTDYPCGQTSLIIHGHHEPPLQDGGILLKQAGALLNARLTCKTKLVTVPGAPGHRSKEEVHCTIG